MSETTGHSVRKGQILIEIQKRIISYPYGYAFLARYSDFCITASCYDIGICRHGCEVGTVWRNWVHGSHHVCRGNYVR